MGIDTKLDLNKCKFQQISGDILNLSGTTCVFNSLKIANSGSLSILNNHAAGKVLTSDSNGIGTWQNVSGGTAGSITGATNGLSVYGKNIGLGGILTGNTSIILNDNNLNFINIGFDSGSGFNSGVQVIAIQGDGKILVGGSFTTYSGVTANFIIRLNSDGTIDNTFNSGSGFNGYVTSIAIQSDGKILVGGHFSQYSGVSIGFGIIRLNTDGTIDNTFNSGSGFSNGVSSMAIQSGDGKILVGGHFSQYSGVSIGFGIIRLNTDGTIDNTFNSGSGFSNGVSSIAIQNDGKILIGGDFSSYSGVSIGYGIIRLNTDGTIDNTFNSGSGFNNGVTSIAIQSDGKIVVGGYFNYYSGVTANYIIRLNTDGTIDNTFNSGSGFSNDVQVIVIQGDGKILIGGYFIQYSGVTVNYIIRLNTDGTIDNTFDSGSGFNNHVYTLAIQSDGKILIGGYFTTYKDQTANYIIRLNTDGSIDNIHNITFNDKVIEYGADYSIDYTNRSLVDKNYVDVNTIKGATNGLSVYGKNVGLGGILTGNTNIFSTNSNLNFINYNFNSGSGFYGGDGPYSLAIQNDGKILVGGEYITYNGVTANHIIRLNIDGTIDNTFDSGSGFDGDVYTLATQSNGKIVIGGYFSSYSGVSIGYGIIRLNTDGTIDNTFNSGSGFNNGVQVIAIQGDGKILAGGDFTQYSGVTANYIIRLNTDGTIDNTFNSGSGFSNGVSSMAIQSGDGKILAGGDFTQYSGVTANYIIRLNTDGTIDNTFNSGSGFNGGVSSMAIQGDGKILAGGEFTSYSGVSIGYGIIRLNTDGTIDNTFNSGSGFSNNGVTSIAIQSDGKILIGGSFTSYSGITANRIIRLNTDGTIDNTFNSGSGFNNGVSSMAIQSGDSKILVGGYFNIYNGKNIGYGIIRLDSNGSIDQNEITFNSKVIEYGADYSSYYTDRSLVDKNYVDTHGGGGGTITGATNGLSVSGKNIELGGNLLKDTYINLCGHQFIVSGNSQYSDFIGGVDFYTRGECFTVYGDNGSCVEKTKLQISDTQAIFTDSRSTPVGIQYNDDYSATYSSCSLVDKNYVDTHGGSGISEFTISGNSSSTGFTVNHAKNKQFVAVEVVQGLSPYATVYTNVQRTNANNVCITFDTAPLSGTCYKILVIG